MPGQPSGVDKIRSLVEGHARACLDDLAGVSGPPRPDAAVFGGGGWTVLVVASPAPAGADVPGLTQCDRDCLSLLSQTEPLR